MIPVVWLGWRPFPFPFALGKGKESGGDTGS
jgi:hypothetical protein